jgi:hypothetical protein
MIQPRQLATVIKARPGNSSIIESTNQQKIGGRGLQLHEEKLLAKARHATKKLYFQQPN